MRKLFTIITSVSLIFTFFLAGNNIFYKPRYEWGRNFNYFIYKEKMATLFGNKHLSIQFFPYRPRLFHFTTENERAQINKNGHRCACFRSNTINININNKSKRFSIILQYYELALDKIKLTIKIFQYFIFKSVKILVSLLRLFWDGSWTGTRSVPTPFFTCTARFLVPTRPFRNESAFAWSTVCNSAADWAK